MCPYQNWHKWSSKQATFSMIKQGLELFNEAYQCDILCADGSSQRWTLYSQIHTVCPGWLCQVWQSSGPVECNPCGAYTAQWMKMCWRNNPGDTSHTLCSSLVCLQDMYIHSQCTIAICHFRIQNTFNKKTRFTSICKAGTFMELIWIFILLYMYIYSILYK